MPGAVHQWDHFPQGQGRDGGIDHDICGLDEAVQWLVIGEDLIVAVRQVTGGFIGINAAWGGKANQDGRLDV